MTDERDGRRLPDADFYTARGRESYGLLYFLLMNPRRSKTFPYVVLGLCVCVPLFLTVLILVSAADGAAGVRGHGQ
jgi:hypothetical protein